MNLIQGRETVTLVLCRKMFDTFTARWKCFFQIAQKTQHLESIIFVLNVWKDHMRISISFTEIPMCFSSIRIYLKKSYYRWNLVLLFETPVDKIVEIWFCYLKHLSICMIRYKSLDIFYIRYIDILLIPPKNPLSWLTFKYHDRRLITAEYFPYPRQNVKLFLTRSQLQQSPSQVTFSQMPLLLQISQISRLPQTKYHCSYEIFKTHLTRYYTYERNERTLTNETLKSVSLASNSFATTP